MLDPGLGDAYVTVNVAVALAVLVVPIVFLLLVAAAWQRSRRGPLGTWTAALLAFTGGLSLGTMLLVTTDVTVEAPIAIAAVALVVALWRRRRRAQAGWLLAGAAAPWTILWSWYLILLAGGATFDPQTTTGLWAVGAVPLAAGFVLARRGDPAPPPPDPGAAPGLPGSRRFGSIAEAIRDAARIGPFGLPEIATLVAIVATYLVVPLIIPASWPSLLRLVVPVAAAGVIGTEVFVRAWPALSRRAFEAFSWLGEWEAAEVRRLTGGGIPSSPQAASLWLARPERPEELAFRVEVLVFAGRHDEARALLPKLPTATPWDRFSVAALRDLVEWHAGGEGDIAGMAAAAAAIGPDDSDDRLRAEVSIAVSKVKRLMATGVASGAEAVAPLVAVRERLGSRADGQIGRALRRRLLPVMVVVAAVAVVIGELLRGSALPPF